MNKLEEKVSTDFLFLLEGCFSAFQHSGKRKSALERCFSSFQRPIIAQQDSYYLWKIVFQTSSILEKENQNWKDDFHFSRKKN
jgi:hypothetical protein